MNVRPNPFPVGVSITTIKLKPLVIHVKQNKRPSISLRSQGSTKVNYLKLIPLCSISTFIYKESVGSKNITNGV